MFAAKGLEKQHIVTKNTELTHNETARQVEVLKRNDLISNNEILAQEVFNYSEMQTFAKGYEIIGENEEKDDVFFLLFGDVSITKAKKEIDTLSAPSTVGELAADAPGEPRTASVTVASETLRARVISGSEFRRIRDNNPEFAKSLHGLVGNMNRRKIAQKVEPALWSRAVKPIAISIVSFILSVALMHNFLSFDLGQNLSLSGLVALVITGIATYFDHQHRYGRMFTAVLFSTLLYILYFGTSIVVYVDGRSTPVPFLWNFSTETEQSPLFAIAALFALVLLCVVCERADHNRNGFDS